MIKPYYDHGGIKIYHGDCREILPEIGEVDAVVTDPPYGIKQDRGMGGGYSGFGSNKKKRTPRRYVGGWDSDRPSQDTINLCLSIARVHVIWGGNYFSDLLPQNNKWFIWDKEQTMPTYSDAELAWTSLKGNSVKMFRYCGAGMMAKERDRQHPTQKPLELMRWCILKLPEGCQLILDPFMGSGTTLRAAKDLGRNAIGIEIEEKYCEVSAERLAQEVMVL